MRGGGGANGQRLGGGPGSDREQNFATCFFVVSNAYKNKKKWRFLKDALELVDQGLGRRGQGRVGLAGQGLRGGGVGGPRKEQISQHVSCFLSFLKTSFFFFFVRVRIDKNTTHVAKFAPSLGPVPLPPTPRPCTLYRALAAGMKALVYPPVHQASSGGYPPPPQQGILQKNAHFYFFLSKNTHALAPPSQPFPGPSLWNQGPWSIPPPSKSAIFLHYNEICSVSGPVPLPPTPPPEPQPLDSNAYQKQEK